MLCLFTLLSFMLSCYIIFFYIYLFTYLLKILKKRDHPTDLKVNEVNLFMINKFGTYYYYYYYVLYYRYL